MTLTYVVTHSPCNDGHAASRLLLAHFAPENAKIVDWNLRDPLPSELANSETTKVVFVDCAPPMSVANTLAENGIDVLILDHHESNAKVYTETPVHPLVEYQFAQDKCATEIVCDYYKIPRPWFVEHIANHDLWRHDRNPDSAAYIRTLTIPFDLDALANADQAAMLAEGRRLLAADEATIQHYCDLATKVTINFGDNSTHEASVVRLAPDFADWALLSKLGARLAATSAIALMIDSSNKISARSDRENPKALNCAEFCKRFGGGGHANAAGCTIPGAYTAEPINMLFNYEAFAEHAPKLTAWSLAKRNWLTSLPLTTLALALPCYLDTNC